MKKEKTAPPVAANRQAYHNYFIHDTYECGIALTGTEVKSIRAGRVNLRDSFAKVERGKSICGMPTSVPMNREISSTMIPSAPESCCSINRKSARLK